MMPAKRHPWPWHARAALTREPDLRVKDGGLGKPLLPLHADHALLHVRFGGGDS